MGDIAPLEGRYQRPRHEGEKAPEQERHEERPELPEQHRRCQQERERGDAADRLRQQSIGAVDDGKATAVINH
jgi:hypothetical protein